MSRLAPPAEEETIIGDDRWPLSRFASEINQQVDAAETHAQSAVAAALRAGALLIDAKKKVGHGGWQNWLSQNTKLSVRTGQLYMRLSRKTPLPQEAQRVSLLPLRRPIAAIASVDQAKPKAPRSTERVQGEKKASDQLLATAETLRQFVRLDLAPPRQCDIDRVHEQLQRALIALDQLDWEVRKEGRAP